MNQLASLAVVLLAVGCAGDGDTASAAATGGGSGTTTTAAGSGGGGGAGPAGECSVDDDCAADGAKCIELVPGGYTVCAAPPPEATSCTSEPPDECCDSSECAFGKCYFAAPPCCGGACQTPHNVCIADQCFMDSDCPTGSICLPPGIGYGRSCLVADCELDADCSAEAGGVCALVENPCPGCGDALRCVYPGGCRSSSDCPGGHCDAGECVAGEPACPL